MRKETGFTLVELVIVLAIIGIMVGIAVPTIFNRLPDMRLKAAAWDLQGNIHFAKLGAIKNNANWAIVFDTSVVPGRYFICSDDGIDNTWDGGPDLGGDDTVEKTVTLGTYKSGIDYGHGNAGAPLGGGWDDEVTYSTPVNIAVFNPRGTSNSGYVYLKNEYNDLSYGVGTLVSGMVKLRKWAGAWIQ